MPVCVLLLAGAKDSLVGGPTVEVTVRLAFALLRPVADAVMVALPAVVGVKPEVATPPLGLTGETGSNEPETPVSENVTALVAVVSVFP